MIAEVRLPDLRQVDSNVRGRRHCHPIGVSATPHVVTPFQVIDQDLLCVGIGSVRFARHASGCTTPKGDSWTSNGASNNAPGPLAS